MKRRNPRYSNIHSLNTNIYKSLRVKVFNVKFETLYLINILFIINRKFATSK